MCFITDRWTLNITYISLVLTHTFKCILSVQYDPWLLPLVKREMPIKQPGSPRLWNWVSCQPLAELYVSENFSDRYVMGDTSADGTHFNQHILYTYEQDMFSLQVRHWATSWYWEHEDMVLISFGNRHVLIIRKLLLRVTIRAIEV